MNKPREVRLVLREDKTWERLVYGEVLVPEVTNVYNDYWTRDAIRHAAHLFMMTGFGIDHEHDNIDRTGLVHVVESFIARAGDPDFIEGSWVVAMKVLDDDLWEAILNNEINGYSYEALVEFMDATLVVDDDGIRTGLTEPDVNDGHVHEFMVTVDENNRPIEGGTSVTNGHSHLITTHTVTEEEDGHSHRYNLVQGKDGK